MKIELIKANKNDTRLNMSHLVWKSLMPEKPGSIGDKLWITLQLNTYGHEWEFRG